MQSFIELKEVYFQYEQDHANQKYALENINMNINRGEFIVIVGHNGSGKSTLAKHFNSIYLPSSGDITIDSMNTKDDEKIFDIRKKVGLVLQNPDNQIVAGIVEEDVAFGCENIGMSSEKIRERVDSALKAVDMYDYRKHSPDKLSGGQKQRIAIAGIMAMEPECIVLDEPTAMLDPKGREEVISAIQKLNQELNITIILITHYMEEAILADRVIVMDTGKILMQGTPKEVFSQVELLKQHQLDVPQCTEIIYRLKKFGFELPDGVLKEEECIDLLEKLLKGAV